MRRIFFFCSTFDCHRAAPISYKLIMVRQRPKKVLAFSAEGNRNTKANLPRNTERGSLYRSVWTSEACFKIYIRNGSNRIKGLVVCLCWWHLWEASSSWWWSARRWSSRWWSSRWWSSRWWSSRWWSLWQWSSGWWSSGWCSNETFRAWRRVQAPLMGS